VRALDRVQPLPRYSLNLTHDYTADYAQIWKTQASVRTVVSFLGRNIASLGLHVYRRVSDTDRVRDTESAVAQLIAKPNPWTTHYRLIDGLVQDLAIFDVAYLLKVKGDATAPQGLIRIPPRLVEPIGQSWLTPDGFRIRGTRGEQVVAADAVVAFHGYAADETWGAPPLEALRQVLAEEWEASRMRAQMLRNGARVSGYLKRPAGAAWSREAQEKFARAWRAQYTGGGPESGGTPILEDGMEFVAASQTSQQLQYIESRKLTREEVASAFFIPPPMIGILDKATFSNITEQHKMLYQDTLGPWLRMIEEELSLQVLPDFGLSDVYLEFNIKEKMRGSFQEEAASMQTAVGGPWMSRNEARARQNLPSVEGGDDLIIPLNVLIGGQASPTDSGSQNVVSAPLPSSKGVELSREAPHAPLKVKGKPDEEDSRMAANVLRKFFKRQRAAVLSELGAKDSDWWDGARWDEELSDDLYALAVEVSKKVGEETAEALGYSADDYSVARTEKFLRAVANSRASAINQTTRDQIEAALYDDVSEDAEKSTPAGVFDEAESSRAVQAGITLATTLTTFAITEMGKQSGRSGITKTWLVTSSNPRPSHAAMNGETVSIDETYSNGMEWPGDIAGAGGDVDEIANCTCTSELTIP
jgi:HK97 family phage portal protein